jgi:F0F1-type ATP synthase membrane subunit b/b'
MIRLIEILEVFLMTALMIGGTSQVIIPAFWGKPLFPMFRSKNRSQKRLDDAKQRLEAAKAAKEAAEHEVEAARLDPVPTPSTW